MMIPLIEYARKHGLDPSNTRKKAARGDFLTAEKMSGSWVIDSDEPYIDRRIKHGHYVGWRVPKKPREQ